jgi:DNA-binding NtrC family response regulator
MRDPNVIRVLDEHGEVRAVEAVEKDLIGFARTHYRGHMTEMARRLGIGRSTLYRKMREYGLVEGTSDESDEISAA